LDRAVSVHRAARHDRGRALPPRRDVDPRADGRRLAFEIRHRHGTADGDAHGAARHAARRLAARLDGMTGARDPVSVEDEPQELAPESGRLCRLDRLLPDEIRLLEAHGPAESGLEGIRGLVDVVPIEAVAHLEAERVARAESDGPDSFRRPRLEDAVPEIERSRRTHVDLESVLARVSGAGHDRPVVAESLLERLVESERGRAISVEPGDDGFGARPLDR